jgi:hypothetical protein
MEIDMNTQLLFWGCGDKGVHGALNRSILLHLLEVLSDRILRNAYLIPAVSYHQYDNLMHYDFRAYS